MWHTIVVKRDSSFFKLAERPLSEQLADELNKLEEREGPITDVIQILDTEHIVEVVVQVEPQKVPEHPTAG